MGIENIMFLALGFLVAGLLAIAIVPAIVRRAVRLTRRRIEAATPMTLSEFRADKDKLRAEFAIATRRAELQRERLREKVAAQAVSLDTMRSELSALRTERDEQFDAIRARQNHIDELKRHIEDLQAENRELVERLREAERAYPAFSVGAELDSGVDLETRFDPETLSGHYERDVEDLLMALGIERQRADLHRGQVRVLVERLDAALASDGYETDPVRSDEPIPSRAPVLRPANNALDLALAHIESAENRLNALLGIAARPEEAEDSPAGDPLLEEDLSEVRERVEDIQRAIRDDYGTERFDPDALRGDLEIVASDISAIVYAADAEDANISLFDRISRFAGDTFSPAEAEAPTSIGAISARIDALRDRQARQTP